jgi:hypothetical protein
LTALEYSKACGGLHEQSDGRQGEGFRTPARAGRAWGMKPAYGNGPGRNRAGDAATARGDLLVERNAIGGHDPRGRIDSFTSAVLRHRALVAPDDNPTQQRSRISLRFAPGDRSRGLLRQQVHRDRLKIGIAEDLQPVLHNLAHRSLHGALLRCASGLQQRDDVGCVPVADAARAVRRNVRHHLSVGTVTRSRQRRLGFTAPSTLRDVWQSPQCPNAVTR